MEGLPRTDLEFQLAGLWQETLLGAKVGIFDNFFEAGGHSLLYARLLYRLRKATGARLTLAELIQAPTIATQAELIRRQGPPRQPSPLIPIRHKGDKPPLFLVHPLMGTVFCFTRLLPYLDPDQPLYAFQSMGIEGDTAPLDRLETMAKTYLDALMEVQPEGPYRVGGWSMGGVIAYEMARQLRQRGKQVQLLAMFDSWSPLALRSQHRYDDVALASGWSEDLGLLFGKAFRVPETELKGRDQEGRFQWIIEKALAQGILPADFDETLVKGHYDVLQINAAALAAYVPGPYDGPATLVRAKQIKQGSKLKRTPDRGWQELLERPLQILETEGDHYTMFDKTYLPYLASQLNQALNEAEKADL